MVAAETRASCATGCRALSSVCVRPDRPACCSRSTWSRPPDSNRPPADYKSAALPDELGRRRGRAPEGIRTLTPCGHQDLDLARLPFRHRRAEPRPRFERGTSSLRVRRSSAELPGRDTGFLPPWWRGDFRRSRPASCCLGTRPAEVPGLEPRRPGPEPGGLPITQYPIEHGAFSSPEQRPARGRAEIRGTAPPFDEWAERDLNPHHFRFLRAADLPLVDPPEVRRENFEIPTR
jgi:hypothetical protein